ncbi:DUF1433 domain-containing protein [Listeria sp. ILCC792]|uniref:DUF1433 domain-containing protein n=1 Tax=Listeria sp. ILCC792 TaxID=1918331 RepID=UPI0013563BD4|nr:DUF1433 domain-containing protein [Listeria sp. ILCC792]
MKKVRIIGIALAIILGLFCISIPIITGGYLFMNTHEEKKESGLTESEKKLMEEQKEDITLYLKYNYKDITSVTLTSVKSTPLGPTIQGYVNNNKNIAFTALSSNNGFESGLEVSDELLKLSKFDKDKSVSEIKKEKQETSMNTAENPKRSLEDIMAELREQEAHLFKRNRI